MLIDILIAAAIGVLQVTVTWYAIDISLKEKRLKNAIIIGILGGLAVGLTVWGAIRSGVAQNDLQAKLDRIQHNTETPPSVQVTNNIPPAPAPTVVFNAPGVAPKPFHIKVTKLENHDPREGILAENVYFQNEGDVAGEFIAAGSSFYSEDMPPDLSTEEGRKKEDEFERHLIGVMDKVLDEKKQPPHPMKIEAHGISWVTLSHGQSSLGHLSPEQIQKLLSQKAVAYTVAVYRYKSAGRLMETRVCNFWNTDPRVRADCIGSESNGDVTTKQR